MRWRQQPDPVGGRLRLVAVPRPEDPAARRDPTPPGTAPRRRRSRIAHLAGAVLGSMLAATGMRRIRGRR